MGRKGQGHKPKHTVKTKNQRNISNEEKEIIESVDKLLRICTLPQQQNVSKALDQQHEIYLITEKIKNLEINKSSVNSVDNRATTATIENFTKWVNENGGQLKGCTISEFKGFELGLMANTEIPQSSLVIAVPRKIMMSIETAMKSDLKDLIDKDQILKNMPNVALAIFLLSEKLKKNSFWKPYIDILPKQYSTVMYFTLEDLGELRGSPTLEIALRQIKSIARQYAYFHKLFNTSEDAFSKSMRGRFTFDEYCWAVSTVMTRQNTIPSEDGEHMVNALIPLWDMCNHTNGKISTDFNPELDRCECLALKEFKPGEQFFIFYGARTNADLFVHNGFVYEDNVHDGYSVRLGISKSDPLHEKRTALLKKLSIPSTCDFFIKTGPLPIDGRLLAFLRIFNMNEEQLLHWTGSDRSDDLQYVECGLDTELEKKSWSFLQARLKLLLSIYKTTLKEDIKLLEESQLTANKKLAVRMRASEKKILEDAVEYVEQCIEKQ